MDPASISISLLFKAPHLIEAIGTYLGIVESMSKKVDRLISNDFEVGLRHLNDLSETKGQTEFLLKEAWKRFESAANLETGERKALAFLGISVSQFHLGERGLAMSSLKRLSEYEYQDTGERAKRISSTAGMAVVSILFPVIALPVAFGILGTRQKTDSSVTNDHNYSRERAMRNLVEWITKIPSEQRVKELQRMATAYLSESNPDGGI